jgi:hypothetical protein
MGFLIEKENDLDNEKATFRLYHNHDKSIDVTFTRPNMRERLGNLGFSTNRIGYIVKLLNRLYPMPVKRPAFERRFSDKDLVNYLAERGFKVFKVNNSLDIPTAIKILESRGYVVKGTKELETMSRYESPMGSVTKN